MSIITLALEFIGFQSWPEKFRERKRNHGDWWAVYHEYLSSPIWNDKREAVLKRDGYKCVICSGTNNLQVHHNTYARVGEEELEDLTTLCKWCHEAVTRMLRKRK